jgi:hypothetical protein
VHGQERDEYLIAFGSGRAIESTLSTIDSRAVDERGRGMMCMRRKVEDRMRVCVCVCVCLSACLSIYVYARL